MEDNRLEIAEKNNTGTSWTRNEFFEKNGYLVIQNLFDPRELYCDPPKEKGQITYWGKKYDQFEHIPVESQVAGSLARYWYPKYRTIHSLIRMRLEKELGRKLYNTYYYDRFYYEGQELEKHIDRDACEISVTIHVSTDLPKKKSEWPICIKTPDLYDFSDKSKVLVPGENHGVILNPGDGMVYKGCERPHWRDPMPKRNILQKLLKKEDCYYHQIFFHYVLQDGHRAHCAWDKAK